MGKNILMTQRHRRYSFASLGQLDVSAMQIIDSKLPVELVALERFVSTTYALYFTFKILRKYKSNVVLGYPVKRTHNNHNNQVHWLQTGIMWQRLLESALRCAV